MAEADERQKLADGSSALGTTLSDLQLDRLAVYLERLRDWAPRVNLLSRGDLASVVSRHVLDSLAAARGLSEIGSGLAIADLGSGAGLPGIPLAIALEPRRMTLVEPRRKRASFLRSVARDLPAIRLEVACCRAEDLVDDGASATYDAVVSRATLPTADLVRLGSRLLREGGQLLVHRGPGQETAESELENVEVGGDRLVLSPVESIRYRLPGLSADFRIDRWSVRRRTPERST